MPEVGRRSREVIDEKYPQIVWEHSHVLVGEDGKVMTYCVYDAPNEETVRQHAVELGGRLLEELRDARVPLAAVGPCEQLVGDVPDQHVLEAELLLALDQRGGLAHDQVSPLECAEQVR